MKRKKNLLQNGEGNNLNQWNILLWNTSIQRAPPFRGHKIGSRKNVHIIFVSFTSVVGTPGGELGISSDGNDRRIFLGLKFSFLGFLWVRKFGKYFFG